jgi:hypothetical protein
MILLIAASMSKVDLLDPVLPCLGEQIQTYNANAEPGLRIRLRVAVHAGEVHRDRCGWAGADLITTCRLVNGTPLYQHLADTPRSNMALVVSDLIYQSVIRHHYRTVNPNDYTPIRITLKETDELAWLYTPSQAMPMG